MEVIIQKKLMVPQYGLSGTVTTTSAGDNKGLRERSRSPLDGAPRQDSNLRPAGYKCSGFSTGLGLSLHPAEESMGGCRALLRRYWIGSAASSLCTFLPTRFDPSAGFAQDSHSDSSELGRLPRIQPSFNLRFPVARSNSRLLYQLSYRGMRQWLSGRTHSSKTMSVGGRLFSIRRSTARPESTFHYTSKSSVSSSSEVASVLPAATDA